jgi:feruloyl esterase
MGNGGWSGTQETNLTAMSISGDYGSGMNAAAAWKGYVVSTSDNGHVGLFDGSFAMNPDGTINQVLWKDFSERSLHVLADKTKQLTKAYYGKAHQYAYFDGFSTGGRQGLKLAQVYSSDFDGILDGAPAINWTSYHIANLYGPLAMLRDLGAPIAAPKLSATTTAAINACGGAQLGFLTDPLSCRYDPFADAAVLCSGVAGRAGVVGTSTATTCLSAAEAQVFVKAWYGQSADGSAPDPTLDNGSSSVLQGSNRLWFGWTRGTNLATSMGPVPISLSTDQTAISLQDPTYGSLAFKNATGNGTDKWMTLGYPELANV